MTVMLQSPFKGQGPGTLYTGPEEAALVASGSASLVGGTEATGRLQGAAIDAAGGDITARRVARFERLYKDLLARRQAALAGNPRTRPLASGVTVGPATTTRPNTTNFPNVVPSRNGVASFAPYFRVAGGWVQSSSTRIFSLVATRSPAQTTTGGASGVAYQGVHRIIFYSTAAQLWLEVSQPATSPAAIRIIVDGQYVDLTGTTISSDSVNNYIPITFSGGRAPQGRRIEVELAGNSASGTPPLNQFGGVQQAAAEACWAPASIGPRVGIFGDSITAGANAGLSGDAYARRTGDFAGIDDLWPSAISGTGYIVRGSGGATSSFLDRIADMRDNAFDLLLMRGGVNDVLNEGSTFNGITVSPATVQSAASTIISQVRAANPYLPMIFYGPFRSIAAASFDTRAPSYEAAIQAAVVAANDPLIAFIPTIGATPALQAGTGYVGATTGTGWTDWGIGSDGIHPPIEGHAALETRGTSDLFAALKTIAGNLGL